MSARASGESDASDHGYCLACVPWLWATALHENAASTIATKMAHPIRRSMWGIFFLSDCTGRRRHPDVERCSPGRTARTPEHHLLCGTAQPQVVTVSNDHCGCHQ